MKDEYTLIHQKLTISISTRGAKDYMATRGTWDATATENDDDNNNAMRMVLAMLVHGGGEKTAKGNPCDYLPSRPRARVLKRRKHCRSGIDWSADAFD